VTAPGREPTPEELAQATRARRRREPRYRVFIGTGVLVGLVAAGVVTLLVPAAQDYSRTALLGYLVVALGVSGGLLGGLVAVLLAPRGR
jgi:hypothetical protein